MRDRYGPRGVQVALLVMAAAGSAVFGLSSSLPELIVARVLIGLGFAGGLMAAIKTITLWFPPERGRRRASRVCRRCRRRSWFNRTNR